MSSSLTLEQEILLAELDAYRGVDAVEEAHRKCIRKHVASTARWWHRDTLPGHVTASSFVVTPKFDWMLLHLHRKLERWLQFGGHDDGEQHPAKAVLRELAEESGLQDFAFFGHPVIFDLDVHTIPARASMPEHQHFDVRYLFVAPKEQPLRPAEGESEILRWSRLEDSAALLMDVGGHRVCQKLEQLASNKNKVTPEKQTPC